MRTKIYQINSSGDARMVKFSGGDTIDPSIYDEVFNAEIDEENPEAVYHRFNTGGHPLYRGHPLSVPDVVVNDRGAFICDGAGFRKVDFDESKTHRPADLMRIVYVEPHRKPYEAEIEYTLEAEQKAVGGPIETIYNGDDTCLVGNDEAKLTGMEGNRRIGDGSSIMAGPFFVIGLAGEDFRPLTDAETLKYMERFAEPEDITQDEVENDTGYIIYSW